MKSSKYLIYVLDCGEWNLLYSTDNQELAEDMLQNCLEEYPSEELRWNWEEE